MYKSQEGFWERILVPLKAYLKVLYLPFVLKQHEQAFVLYRMTIQAYKSASREQGVFFFLRDEQVSMCVWMVVHRCMEILHLTGFYKFRPN